MQETLLANQLVRDQDGYYTDYRLIRLREVMRLSGLSKSSIYPLSAENRFPRSVALVPGGTSRAWVEPEIFDFLQQRIEERNQEISS
jgi:prophage regulatory protein